VETTSYSYPDWVDEESYPFKDQWMLIKGHQVHYVDEGPRDKPVLLFVHPGPGWSYTYRYQIQKLSNDFRCVAPDLPGYGLSKPAEDYDFTLLEQSKVLESFVEALDLRNIILWANDGGGPTGILALASHSERVVGLVVGGTFGWSIRQYKSVTRILRIVTGPVFRAINRYTNALIWSTGRMGLGTRSMSKLEREHYARPFKERNSRNRPLKLFRSFLDPATQDGSAPDGSASESPAFRT
jgi:haloalkane dehalogenase